MVMLVGAVAGGAILDFAGRVAKNVPDRLAAAVLVDGAFDLVGRGRRAPQKILREGRATLGRCGRFILRSPDARSCAQRGEARESCKIAPRDISWHHYLR